MMFKLKKKRSKGFTLIELLVAIGITGVMMTFIISGFALTVEKVETTSVIQDIKEFTARLKDIYASSPSYDGLSTTGVIAGNAAPGIMTSGVEMTAVDIDGPSSHFSFKFTAMPRHLCFDVVSTIYRQYDSVTVNGDLISSVGNAEERCSGGSGSTVTATFIGRGREKGL